MAADDPRAVIDANVLAPAIKGTALRKLAVDGIYCPVLSEVIWQEAQYTLTRLDEDKAIWAAPALARWREVKTAIWAEAEPPLPTLPDTGDAHVVGTALAGQAAVIVTENRRDFPKKVLAPLGLEVMSTDRFVFSLMEAQPEEVRKSLFSLPGVAGLPFLSDDNLLTVLQRAGFKQVVKGLQKDG